MSADALFGKYTSTITSNDWHANQEMACLLQRIEDFPSTIILATNLKSGIGEAFLVASSPSSTSDVRQGTVCCPLAQYASKE